MIEILCDDPTSCKGACANNIYHRSRQRQTLNMSVKSMRNSLDHLVHRIFLYKCKTIFSICGSIFSIICTVLLKCVQKVIDNICNNSPWA